MLKIAHSKIILHGLLSFTNYYFKDGYCSLTEMFDKFESLHELLLRYEDISERSIRFKEECLYRYNINKKLIIDSRRYLTNSKMCEIMKNAFNDIQSNTRYDLTTCIEEIYMRIDSIVNQIVEFIKHVSRYYSVKRRISGYLELINNFDKTETTFICDKNTLIGYQGFIRGNSLIRISCPSVSDNENWQFEKIQNSDGIMYLLL